MKCKKFGMMFINNEIMFFLMKFELKCNFFLYDSYK